MSEEGHPDLLKIDIEEWNPNRIGKRSGFFRLYFSQLSAIKRESKQRRSSSLTEESLHRSKQYLESRVQALKPGDFVLMARSDSTIVGFLLVRWDEHEKRTQIEQVYVDINYFRQGIGERLVRRAVEHARHIRPEESKGIFLTTGRENDPAQKMYEKIGFHLSETPAREEGEIRMETDFN